MRAGVRSWRKLSRTRGSQESRDDCKEEKSREGGSRMGGPPRPPQIWQTPRRDGRRTADEKHGAADWLPVLGVHSFSDERRRRPSRASSLTKTTHFAGDPR